MLFMILFYIMQFFFIYDHEFYLYIFFVPHIYVLMYFVEYFRKHETFCQFVTKRGSLLGEMSLSSPLGILSPKLPKGEFVSFNYWLNIQRAKWKGKCQITMGVRTGFKSCTIISIWRASSTSLSASLCASSSRRANLSSKRPVASRSILYCN